MEIVTPDKRKESDMGTRKFEDDDPGYLQWIRVNPQGYVLNGYRPLTADYLIIHRADKKCVTKLRPGAQYWTKNDVKVCSLDIDALVSWAEQNVGGKPKLCGNCRPK